ncbi:TlpA family protein disulfide reductase, partial [uncultured Duncaniella sp.]|uniref:TlpA family protein disulfide reductase n=1 Tax=uncultured Duncaniella sp. TaxID=2768039 RepID=UPI003519E2E8
AEGVLVFFNDPDCTDCNMARIRLDADVSMTELISEGKVKVVAISLAEPDDEWRRHADSFPASWEVGAAPDADLTIDLRSGTPDFYIIDGKHNIRYKHLNITQVLDVARQLKKR